MDTLLQAVIALVPVKGQFPNSIISATCLSLFYEENVPPQLLFAFSHCQGHTDSFFNSKCYNAMTLLLFKCSHFSKFG